MATWNRAHFLPAALDSVIAQTFSNWECLVIDDGSDDETSQIVGSYSKKDQRIKYYSRTAGYKKGLPGSRNCGIDLAQGEYLIFFDDDDIVHPQNLSTCLEQLNRYSDAFFCRYDKKAFSGDQSYSQRFPVVTEPAPVQVSEGEIEKMITGELPFASCSVMWKKDCFDKNKFDEDLMYAEEWELYSRILMAGFTGISIDTILYFNRKHGKSNTGEFWSNDPVRRQSKVRAVLTVIENLKKHDLLTPGLVKYFLRLGFFLQSKGIINAILESSDSPLIKKLIYRGGFYFYPVLRPLFILKGKMIKDLKG